MEESGSVTEPNPEGLKTNRFPTDPEHKKKETIHILLHPPPPTILVKL
jgi:hypothetical protein